MSDPEHGVDLTDIPDLTPLIDVLEVDKAAVIARFAKLGHTACGACIDIGFIVAQRMYIRTLVAQSPEEAAHLMSPMEELERNFEAIFASRVRKAPQAKAKAKGDA